jgi:hypothetical protein
MGWGNEERGKLLSSGLVHSLSCLILFHQRLVRTGKICQSSAGFFSCCLIDGTTVGLDWLICERPSLCHLYEEDYEGKRDCLPTWPMAVLYLTMSTSG